MTKKSRNFEEESEVVLERMSHDHGCAYHTQFKLGDCFSQMAAELIDPKISKKKYAIFLTHGGIFG